MRHSSHADATAYRIVDGTLSVTLADGRSTGLADDGLLVGIVGDDEAPSAILLDHHGLGIEITIDRDDDVGRDDPAGVADVILESAVTAIIDCEDSVATVDGTDKTLAYRNWLGLITGSLHRPRRQGRPLVHPSARPRPHLLRTRRHRRRAARAAPSCSSATSVT